MLCDHLIKKFFIFIVAVLLFSCDEKRYSRKETTYDACSDLSLCKRYQSTLKACLNDHLDVSCDKFIEAFDQVTQVHGCYDNKSLSGPIPLIWKCDQSKAYKNRIFNKALKKTLEFSFHKKRVQKILKSKQFEKVLSGETAESYLAIGQALRSFLKGEVTNPKIFTFEKKNRLSKMTLSSIPMEKSDWVYVLGVLSINWTSISALEIKVRPSIIDVASVIVLNKASYLVPYFLAHYVSQMKNKFETHSKALSLIFQNFPQDFIRIILHFYPGDLKEKIFSNVSYTVFQKNKDQRFESKQDFFKKVIFEKEILNKSHPLHDVLTNILEKAWSYF